MHTTVHFLSLSLSTSMLQVHGDEVENLLYLHRSRRGQDELWNQEGGGQSFFNLDSMTQRKRENVEQAKLRYPSLSPHKAKLPHVILSSLALLVKPTGRCVVQCGLALSCRSQSPPAGSPKHFFGWIWL